VSHLDAVPEMSCDHRVAAIAGEVGKAGHDAVTA
jgi:hypothetical protein